MNAFFAAQNCAAQVKRDNKYNRSVSVAERSWERPKHGNPSTRLSATNSATTNTSTALLLLFAVCVMYAHLAVCCLFVISRYIKQVIWGAFASRYWAKHSPSDLFLSVCIAPDYFCGSIFCIFSSQYLLRLLSHYQLYVSFPLYLFLLLCQWNDLRAFYFDVCGCERPVRSHRSAIRCCPLYPKAIAHAKRSHTQNRIHTLNHLNLMRLCVCDVAQAQCMKSSERIDAHRHNRNPVRKTNVSLKTLRCYC